MTLRRLLLLVALLLIPGAAMPLRAQAAGPDERRIMVMLRLPPAHLRTGNGYSGGYGDDASRGARRRIAQGIARQNGLALIENWPMPSLAIDCFIMAVPQGVSLERAVAAVARNPAVQWSEPVVVYESRATPPQPNDPLLAAQPATAQWQLQKLHGIATGRNVTVAVIDSGVDVGHPDLVGQIALNRNFVGDATKAESHGTAVAGIIGARANNRAGIVGIAPDARIMALRACWQAERRTLCDSLSLARAIEFAVDRRAPIINMSLSGPQGRLLETLLRQGLDKGLAIVAAVDPASADGGFPASLSGVIAVENQNSRSGPTTAYVAPGNDVPAPLPGGQWTLVNGSSFSAAHISGLLALVEQHRGAAKRGPRTVNRLGTGAVDMCAAFAPQLCGAGPGAR